MEGGFSSVEMKVLHGRMSEGRRQAFLAGKFLGGQPPPPYIYDKSKGKPVINPDKLFEMKKLWALAEGQSAHAIAQQMHLPDIFVRRAISDDRLNFYQALRVDPETGNTIQCNWVPVMNAGQAARIQEGRRSRRNNGNPKAFGGLLSNLNLLNCGYCARNVKTWQNSKIRKDGTRLDYYGCQIKNRKGVCARSRMIPQVALDDRVLKNVFSVLKDLDALKMYWFEDQGRAMSGGKLKDLDNEEQILKKKKSRLIDAIADGIIENEDAKKKMQKIIAAITEIKSNRQALLNASQDTPNWNAIDLSRYDYNYMSIEDRRKLLSDTIEVITIYSQYAIIKYKFPRNLKGIRDSRVNLPSPQKGSAKGRKPVYQLEKKR